MQFAFPRRRATNQRALRGPSSAGDTGVVVVAHHALDPAQLAGLARPGRNSRRGRTNRVRGVEAAIVVASGICVCVYVARTAGRREPCGLRGNGYRSRPVDGVWYRHIEGRKRKRRTRPAATTPFIQPSPGSRCERSPLPRVVHATRASKWPGYHPQSICVPSYGACWPQAPRQKILGVPASHGDGDISQIGLFWGDDCFGCRWCDVIRQARPAKATQAGTMLSARNDSQRAVACPPAERAARWGTAVAKALLTMPDNGSP